MFVTQWTAGFVLHNSLNRNAIRWLASILTLAVAFQAGAQDGKKSTGKVGYPTKPVRVIVAVPPGSGADTITRAVALKLSERWGTGVIVDNRPGAGGVIAMEIAANSPPDGYTLLSASPGLVGTATLLKKVKYDSTKAFEPIVQMTTQPYIVVVNTSVPINSISELIAFARKRPGVLNYASSGKGSASHLGTELFKSMARVDMTHIPYKGLGQAITEMAGGQTQVLFSTVVSVLPHIQSGKVRPIAVTTNHRLKAFPALPTVAESGVPGFELSSAYALYAPLKTEKSIVELVNRDVETLLEDPENRALLAAAGTEVADRNTPAQFRLAFLKDAERWKSLVMNSAAMREEIFGSR